MSAFTHLTDTGVPFDPIVWDHAIQLERKARADAGDLDRLKRFQACDWSSWRHRVGDDGRLHPSYRQVPSTSRIHTTKPNLQGVPRGWMRQAVRQTGSLVITADWSGSHLRILADLSSDPALIADLTAGDPYAAIASEIGLDPAVDRKRVKTAVLLTLNGGGSRSRLEILPEAAYSLPETMAKRWPLAMGFVERIVADATANNGVLTTPAGTTVRIDPDRLYGAPGCYLQGVEADGLRDLVGRIRALESAGLPIQLILTVHDEIVVLCTDPSRVDLMTALVADAMGSALPVRPELRSGCASVSYGPSWGQQDGSAVHADLPALPPPKPGIVDALVDPIVAAYDAKLATERDEAEFVAEMNAEFGIEPEPEPEPEPLSAADLRKMRAEDAGRAESSAKFWIGPIRRHLRSVGFVDRDCGFNQVLTDDRSGRIHHRDCGKRSCLHCVSQRVALKFAAIESMNLYDLRNLTRGDAMSRRDLWTWEIPNSRFRAWKDALRRSASNSSNIVGGVEEINAHGFAAFSDGFVTVVVATTDLKRSRKWGPLAKRVTDLSDLLTDQISRILVPVERPDPEGVEMISPDATKTYEVPKNSITSSHTLNLDPQTLFRAANKTQWRVAHDRARPIREAAALWNAEGVLKQAQTHDPAAGLRGFVATHPIRDPAQRERILALAAEPTTLIPAPEPVTVTLNEDVDFDDVLDDDTAPAELVTRTIADNNMLISDPAEGIVRVYPLSAIRRASGVVFQVNRSMPWQEIIDELITGGMRRYAYTTLNPHDVPADRVVHRRGA